MSFIISILISVCTAAFGAGLGAIVEKHTNSHELGRLIMIGVIGVFWLSGSDASQIVSSEGGITGFLGSIIGELLVGCYFTITEGFERIILAGYDINSWEPSGF